MAVVAALKRVLDSEELRSSRRSRDFLAYVVTETLGGRGDRLKERTVARYAMGRDGSFSGTTDSGARVQATRLRAALAQYYAGSGANEDLVLDLPRGSYVPTFAYRRSTRTGASADTLRPGIAVVALDDLRPRARKDPTARALTDSLVRALSSFPELRVVGPVSSERGTASLADPRALARSFDVEYVLTGELLSSGPVLRLSITVHDGATGAVVWSEKYDGPRGRRNTFEDEDDIVRRVAATVGDVRGVVRRDVERQHANDDDPLRPSAILAFYRFADSGTRRDTEVAARELVSALETRPGDAVLLAMAGWTHCFLAIMGWADDGDATVDVAEELASRALAIDPVNAHAHQVLAGVALVRGLPDQCRRHALRTVELSPVNASLLYTSGVLLIQVGDWDTGIDMIRESNRLNPHHPGFQHVFLGIERLLSGDDAGALAEMSLLRHPDDVWGPLLRCLALAGQGYEESARHELAAAVAMAPELLDHEASYVTDELRDAPLAVRVELRRRLLDWLAGAGSTVPDQGLVGLAGPDQSGEVSAYP